MATALFTRSSPTVPPVEASAKIAELERRVTFLKKVAAFTRDVARKHGAQEPEFKMPLHSPPPSGSIPQASGSGPGGHKRRGPHQRAAAANLAADTPVANQAIEAFVSYALDSLPVDAEKTDENDVPLVEENYQQEDDLEWTNSVLDALAAAPLLTVSGAAQQNPPGMAPPEGSQAGTSEEVSEVRAVSGASPETPQSEDVHLLDAAPSTSARPPVTPVPPSSPVAPPTSSSKASRTGKISVKMAMLLFCGLGILWFLDWDEVAVCIERMADSWSHNLTFVTALTSCIVGCLTFCLGTARGRKLCSLILAFLPWFPVSTGTVAAHSVAAPDAGLVWELQLAGGPIPDMTVSEAHIIALLADSGSAPANTHYVWCGDSGCNRMLTDNSNEFVPGTMKAVDITITVAKAGITMKATAIGDCNLHTFDQNGKPWVIKCKDVLYVPGAAKSLLSLTALGLQGYQYVHTATDPNYPPGLHLPGTSAKNPRYIPLQIVNGLSYIATRNDFYDTGGRMLTRANKYVQWHRNLGFMPMAALRKTKQWVIGLEDRRDSHFPGNQYSDSVVKEGKLHHTDQRDSSGHRGSRPMECIHWDTVGPMRSKSIKNQLYATVFVCSYSGYAFLYGHASTADIPLLLERFYADSILLQEKHGPIRCVRRDNSSVNVSQRVMEWLIKKQIRSETSNPYEPWQNGKPERMLQTLLSTARTLILSSGLDGRFWLLAMQYATRIHNIQYSACIDSSPYVMMHGSKPDVSGDHQFGVEAWLYVQPEIRQDPKLGRRGEPCIFVGYPLNQHGYLVWCPARGPNTVVSTSNVVFGTICPKAPHPQAGLLPDTAKEVFLPHMPVAFLVEEVRGAPDLRFVGTCEDRFVLVSDRLHEPRSLAVTSVMDLLYSTLDPSLAAAHLSLVDSLALVSVDLAPELGPVPRTPAQALSDLFAPEWKPAMENEIQGFLKHRCFQPVPYTPSLRTLPGQWIFTRKRTGQPKARFVIGGHRQRLGTDYFEFKNYCAVLASRDNRILLALAAAHGWCIYQTDVEQAFLHGVLDDVDLYVRPPALYPCPTDHVLKLLKAVYGLHQAPPKFKKEVTDWFRSQGYSAANDSETVWILRKNEHLLIHALYADDFLHCSNNKDTYSKFREQLKKRFDIKSGTVGVYLGNRIVVESEHFKISIDQSKYIQDILDKFDMGMSHPVGTPMTKRLSTSERGEELSNQDKAAYRVMVGSLLYLACWTRPDIAFAVSELSRFVSDPGSTHLQAAKRVLRYLKGTQDLGLKYTRPSSDLLNQLWGCVDSDWAGCVDTRKSTTGYVLMLNGAAISWKSKRQNVVALSSAEAEFMAASTLVQEVIYIRKLLDNLGFTQNRGTEVGEDNRTCIAWSEGSVGGSDRAKHIDLRLHFVHQAVQDKIISLRSIKSEDNIADLLTKPLAEPAFLVLRKQLMGL